MPKMFLLIFMVTYRRLAVLFTLLNRGQSHFFSFFFFLIFQSKILASACLDTWSAVVISLLVQPDEFSQILFVLWRVWPAPLTWLGLPQQQQIKCRLNSSSLQTFPVTIRSLLFKRQAVATVCVCVSARVHANVHAMLVIPHIMQQLTDPFVPQLGSVGLHTLWYVLQCVQNQTFSSNLVRTES